MTSIPPPEKVGAVVPAAGLGERMPGPVAKQFRLLAGIPLLHHTLLRLAAEGRVGSMVLVLPPYGMDSFEVPEGLTVSVRVVAGGARRQDSVANGLAALPEGAEWVAVHDGARPLLPSGLIEACLAGALESGASIAALPVSDTLKRAGSGDFVAETVPRESLWLAQTPQVARRDLLERAMRLAAENDFQATDEAALLEAAGVRVKLVPGARSNLKITTPGDLAWAESFLARREAAGAAFVASEGAD